MSTYSQQQWQDDYEDQPVRLLITCRRAGYEPWALLREVVAGAGPEERQQAGEIKIRSRTCDGGKADLLPEDASKPVHMLVVTNTSTRPVRNLAAQIEVSGATSPGPRLAELTGRIEPVHLGSTATADTFVPAACTGRQELLDAGDNAAFAWSLDTETYPKAQFTIRFADDQEVDWEVGPDLRPRKHPIRDW